MFSVLIYNNRRESPGARAPRENTSSLRFLFGKTCAKIHARRFFAEFARFNAFGVRADPNESARKRERSTERGRFDATDADQGEIAFACSRICAGVKPSPLKLSSLTSISKERAATNSIALYAPRGRIQ